MKFWFDALTPKQARLMVSLYRALKQDHPEIQAIFTTRDYEYTISTFNYLQVPHFAIGRHGGKTLKGKLIAFAERVIELADYIDQEKPNLLISFCSPSATRVAFGLGIPIISYMDTPHATAVAKLSFSLSNKIIFPSSIDKTLYLNLGANESALYPYNGVDEIEWIKDYQPKPEVLKQLQLEPHHKIIVFRPEESSASYYKAQGGMYKQILTALLDLDPNIRIVFFPRYSAQQDHVKQLGKHKIIIPPVSLDTLSLFYYAKVTITGGGTMSRESALMGTPSITYFPRKLEVNTYLENLGFPVYHETHFEKIIELTKIFLRQEKKSYAHLLKTLETPSSALRTVLKDLIPDFS